MKWIIDVSQTSHCYHNTGIQRVTRSLYYNIKKYNIKDIHPICFDPYFKDWRKLNSKEKLLLDYNLKIVLTKNRKPKWTLFQKINSFFLKFIKNYIKFKLTSNSILIVPEIFDNKFIENLNYFNFFNKKLLKIGIFHDAIALKYPIYTPYKTVKRIPAYMEELSNFDAIAAVSKASANHLLEYWEKIKVKKIPIVKVIPLGCEFKKSNKYISNNKKIPKILCVSTIEARKNHETLLKAVKILWDQGLSFELILIGMLNVETGFKVSNIIKEMLKDNYPLKWKPYVSDDELSYEYETCYFTVYPSVIEGFGLPILESIFYKKPCICNNVGAISEIASDGGCLQINITNKLELAINIKNLLMNKNLWFNLSLEAKNRKIKSWKDYSEDIINFAKSIIN